MTNKELQERLARLPADAQVYHRGYVGTVSEGKIIDINLLLISEESELDIANFFPFHFHSDKFIKHILI